MSLSAGKRLGRYEIRSQLGAGEMGEVYLAEDIPLRRKVALKVLPADLASDQDRMRRFEQEAMAAAALNHPNIAHIYEIGEHDNTHFIAMEFNSTGCSDLSPRCRLPSSISVNPVQTRAVPVSVLMAPLKSRRALARSRSRPMAENSYSSLPLTESHNFGCVPCTRSLRAHCGSRIPFPFWSPDSRSIAFGTGVQLKRIDLDTGTVQKLLDTSSD